MQQSPYFKTKTKKHTGSTCTLKFTSYDGTFLIWLVRNEPLQRQMQKIGSDNLNIKIIIKKLRLNITAT